MWKSIMSYNDNLASFTYDTYFAIRSRGNNPMVYIATSRGMRICISKLDQYNNPGGDRFCFSLKKND